MGYGFAGQQEGEEVEIDGLHLAEKFKEDFYSLVGGSDAANGAFHSLERAVGDLHLIADGDGGGNGDQFGIV